MSAVKLKKVHPDDALAQLPPPLPAATNSIPVPAAPLSSPSSGDYSNSQHRLRLASGNEETIRRYLLQLSDDLHWCHRQYIQWPDESLLDPPTYVLTLSTDLLDDDIVSLG